MTVEYLPPIPVLTGKAAKEFERKMKQASKRKAKLSFNDLKLLKEMLQYTNEKKDTD